ncbi:MAG: FecR family protein [Patescibacteria group bacterium]|jgi:hypothetical protein|nr:FecR family protein [Patescibacteria group bacterium]
MKSKDKDQDVIEEAVQVVKKDLNQQDPDLSQDIDMEPADDALKSDSETKIDNDDNSKDSSDINTTEVSESNDLDSYKLLPTDNLLDDAESTLSTEYAIKTTSPSRGKFIKVLVPVAIVTIALFGVGVFSLVTNKNKPEPAVNGAIETGPTLSANVTVIDGKASFSKNGENWQELKADQVINQGDWIETTDSSRVVLLLDDGSAIRLNENTKIVLKSTNPNNIVITNEIGEVYTRVVTNTERKFTVISNNNEYTALGTAYKTVNTDKVKGVQVYHSSVKSGDKTVTEGKQWLIIEGADKDIQDISLDELKNDTFIKWNAEQDKASNEFKDKLGYLVNLDKPVEQPKPAPAPEPGASINLSGSVSKEKGIQLSWSTINIGTVDGYKIVKSTKNSTPIFGKDGSLYIKGSNTKSYLWGVTDGGKYYIRVCGYVASSASCNVYSNTITVTAPKVNKIDSSDERSGSLNLKSVGGSTVEWTLNGKSPGGYKLVWNTTGSPVYPGSSYQYYSSESTKSGNITNDPGTYNVRVCMYKDGNCNNYSNEITVTITKTN